MILPFLTLALTSTDSAGESSTHVGIFFFSSAITIAMMHEIITLFMMFECWFGIELIFHSCGFLNSPSVLEKKTERNSLFATY